MRASNAAADAREARGDDEMFELQQSSSMQQPSWSEGRLDDLNRKVDKWIERLDDERKELRGEMRGGFDRIDRRFEKVDERFEKVGEEFKAVRIEMREGFEKVDGRFEKVDGRFEKIDGRFEKVDGEFTAVRGEVQAGFAQTQRMLVGAAAVIIAALIGAPHL
jgi:predicted nuclease with TOPRIM domain